MSSRRSRLALVLVALALFLAASAPSARPEAYDDTTEENFIEACELSGSELGDAISSVCRCSYDEIEQTIPFEDFETLDDELRSDINAALSPELSTIVANCIRSSTGS